MLFKCKICGGNLNVTSGERVTECEYCGVKQTIPRFTEPETQEVYNRANSYLKNNEFDKAENLYNQILFKNKKDADAYWNVLMCRYGVTYVKDPASGKYIPTCNRTLYNSIFNDENYLNAIEYADEQQKALYEENAQTIDNIQKGILSVSKKEKPFDIFISYKETDVNGARTNDSIAAQELYNKLTAEGYKVFFSRITLEDKIGTEYEPYIYAALASSKVMITVSSSKENIEAVWVKNEWSRFLSFMAKDSSKSIIPLYYDMPKTDLPDEFAHLTAYDMHENGFEQELIRGIKKLIPTPVVLKERRKKRNKILKRVGIAALACLIVSVICAVPWLLKLPDYNAAMQLYYDKNYPEAAWAFGSLGDYRNCAEMKKKCELSWRKSLATVATENEMGSFSTGAYYVTPNGTVESFSFSPGNAADEIDINKHGKVISIGDGYPSLYALHEDGYVYNSAIYNTLKADWENIIQITPLFNTTSVALRNDGTLAYGNLQIDSNEDNDKWLEPISKWNNIIEINCDIARFGNGDISEASLTALDKEGFLHSVVYVYDKTKVRGLDNIGKFKNVKHFDTNISSYYSDSEGDIVYYFDVVALTNAKNVISSIQGVYKEMSPKNVVDVKLLGTNDCLDEDEYSYFDNTESSKILYINKDGKLQEMDKEKFLLEDVVYISNNFAITRSGNIYKCLLIPQQTEAKTKVHNEWIERMR